MATDVQRHPPLGRNGKPSFKTLGKHMRLFHRLGLDRQRRPPGFRQHPQLVRLDAVAGHEPSPKPPVRIYVGT